MAALTLSHHRAVWMKQFIVITRLVHWIIGIILLTTLNKTYDMGASITLFVVLTILYYPGFLWFVSWTKASNPIRKSILYWILLSLVPVVKFSGFKKVGSGPIGAAVAERAQENTRAEASKDGVYGERIAHVWWVAITTELVLKLVWYKLHKRRFSDYWIIVGLQEALQQTRKGPPSETSSLFRAPTRPLCGGGTTE